MADIEKRVAVLREICKALTGPIAVKHAVSLVYDLNSYADLILRYNLLTEREFYRMMELSKEVEFHGKHGQDFEKHFSEVRKMAKTLETKLAENESRILEDYQKHPSWLKKTAIGLTAAIGFTAGVDKGIEQKGYVSFGAQSSYAMEAEASINYKDLAKWAEKENEKKNFKEVYDRLKFFEKLDNPFLHNELGRASEGLNNLNEAIKNYELAISLKKDYDDPYVNLGILYAFKIKDKQKAALYLNQYLKYADNSDPKNVQNVKTWLIKNNLLER